ncbi:hypothetical protein INT45_009790 [Circinella minor]|uniref:Kelch repeat-containing protein n=1 Tax=Circinella minor TaxID=1195481 RepID=A0A8H7RYY3_9FUNG|nr:hypothetical protein INT45_009790 [Circinella minor]
MFGSSWSGALLLIATAAINSVRADTPSPRGNHGCVLLRTTIYCYGGQTRGAGGHVLTSNLFYRLDLSQEKKVDDLSKSWEEITGGNMGANLYFAMAGISELNTFVIDGGSGSGDVYTTQTPTVTYNATGAGAWNLGINSGGHPQVHQAVSDNTSTIYISGGRGKAESGALQFPVQMTLFELPSLKFSSTPATLQSVSSQTRLHHKAALAQDGHTIYYIGGIFPAVPFDNSGGSMYSYGHVEMSDLLMYDTIEGRWTTDKTTGSILPTPRMDHTLTMKPSTGEFIVYGGTQLDTDQPLGDYFYILDPIAKTWSNRTLGTSNGAQGLGPRHSHAAVLTGNSSLFIIFGSSGTTDNRIGVLDIDNYTWLSTVPAVVLTEAEKEKEKEEENGATPGTDQGNGGSISDGDSGVSASGLSSGALAGAIVGAVAGVAIIGALLFFFLRRRRNNDAVNNETGQEESAPRRFKELESDNSVPPYSDTDSLPSHQLTPAYALSATGSKPDGSTSSVSGDQVQRLVMTPVKPDGV